MASACVFGVLPSQAWVYRRGGIRNGSSIGLDVSRCRSGKLSLVGARSLQVKTGGLYCFSSRPDSPVAEQWSNSRYYAPACELLQTIIPSTPLVPHWAEVTCSVPRPPQTFPELHRSQHSRARQREIPSTHSRNGIPSTLNVLRRPSRAFNGHSRRTGVGSLWSAHLHTRRCWIASMEETRFSSSARKSKQGRRRCWKEIGREEVWW